MILSKFFLTLLRGFCHFFEDKIRHYYANSQNREKCLFYFGIIILTFNPIIYSAFLNFEKGKIWPTLIYSILEKCTGILLPRPRPIFRRHSPNWEKVARIPVQGCPERGEEEEEEVGKGAVGRFRESSPSAILWEKHTAYRCETERVGSAALYREWQFQLVKQAPQQSHSMRHFDPAGWGTEEGAL